MGGLRPFRGLVARRQSASSFDLVFHRVIMNDFRRDPAGPPERVRQTRSPRPGAALAGRGVHLLASGGTRTALAEAGFAVTEVSSYTGQPEILGGRVKTLHPKLHGGILARRDLPDDLAALEAQGIEPIDLVVVNLYPFEATIARPGVTFEEAVEQIDIGGPSLIRGAAKNHPFVAVATSPDQYPELIAAIEADGGTTLDLAPALALAVFEQTARYDRAIADYLARSDRAGEATDPPLPRAADARVSTGGPPFATARTPTSGRRSMPSRARRPVARLGADPPRQGAVLQQPPRPRQRPPPDPPLRRAGRDDPQAQQPVRCRRGRRRWPRPSSWPTRAIPSVPSAGSWA